MQRVPLSHKQGINIKRYNLCRAHKFNGSVASAPKQGKHFLHLDDFSEQDINKMLDLAKENKKDFHSRAENKPLQGRTMSMIFQKPSARTRISFETGFHQLGGHAIYLDPASIGLGDREPAKDVARVLSRYNDVIMARLFKHEDLLDLAEHSDVPVINGLTDYNHPCQILADALTINEVTGKSKDYKVVYVGDGNNIVTSWLRYAKIIPIELAVVTPPGYEPDAETLEDAVASNKSKITVTNDINSALQGADVIYTDVWASMGQKTPEEIAKREGLFKGYTVTSDMVNSTGTKTYFMHCLPAERGKECNDEVIESDASVVF